MDAAAASREAVSRPTTACRAPRLSSLEHAAALSPRRGGFARGRAFVVVALLGLYAVMAWTASLSKGLSFDEGLQLAVGYNIWLNQDYRIEGANGDFIKRWATLPYLISRPNFVPSDDMFWRKGLPYELAFRFFFESGNRPESLLLQARAMAALLGVAAGLLVFWCSREIFGFAGGLVSLAMFAFSPHMLAFGGIVSTDMSIILTLFGSTWCIWRLLHEVTPGRLLGSLGFFALLLLAKPTAFVIFPVTAIMIAVKLCSRHGLIFHWRGTSRRIESRRGQAAVLAVLILVHAFAGWSAVWAHYGFRYAASPNPDDASLEIYQHAEPDAVPTVLARLVDWTRKTHFLPEGYRRGMEILLGNDDTLDSYMNGHWHSGGQALFFPYAVWVKTQPALFLLLALAAIVTWSRRSRPRETNASARTLSRAPTLYRLTPFITLIACYVLIAATEDLNIGHRHILPIYPCLYVLAGAVGVAWVRQIAWVKFAAAMTLGWLAVDSLNARPHYLAYFAPQVGGPDDGYKHLVDSSLDWGMNLPGLKKWQDEQDPERREPLFLAYFGTDSPRYHGINAQRLPGFFDRREVQPYALTPGYYAISATLLQSVYTRASGPWSKAYEQRYRIALNNVSIYERSQADPAQHEQFLKKFKPGFWQQEFDIYDHLRFGRLCAWLRHQGEPQHDIGHALLIWKLTYSDLEAALLGAPVELTDDPLPPRQFRRFYPLRD